MNEILKCSCGGDSRLNTAKVSQIFVCCLRCGMDGPFRSCPREAIAAWNLIAAAGELLSACRKALAYFEPDRRQMLKLQDGQEISEREIREAIKADVRELEQEWQSIEQALNAAVAKAEGRSPALA